MFLTNYHAHTIHCDGKNTAEEMVQAAIDRGMKALGFSSHSTTPFDLRFCIQPDGMERYIADIMAVKERYAGQIEIYLGIEDDLYGIHPTFLRDYTIGGTSFLEKDGCMYVIDEKEEYLRQCVREGFGGDFYQMAAYYFEVMAHAKEITGCDFVAHFDLITKFNEGGKLFNEADPRYVKAARESIRHLCSQGAAFEINTGAISRGYRTAPYPSLLLLQAIREFGGSIVLCSDSHSADAVCYRHDLAAELALAAGFRTHRVLTPTGWQEIPIDL